MSPEASSGESLIDEMACFVDTGVVGPSLKCAWAIVGDAQLRLVSIKLLSWLKPRRTGHNTSQFAFPGGRQSIDRQIGRNLQSAGIHDTKVAG